MVLLYPNKVEPTKEQPSLLYPVRFMSNRLLRVRRGSAFSALPLWAPFFGTGRSFAGLQGGPTLQTALGPAAESQAARPEAKVPNKPSRRFSAYSCQSGEACDLLQSIPIGPVEGVLGVGRSQKNSVLAPLK